MDIMRLRRFLFALVLKHGGAAAPFQRKSRRFFGHHGDVGRCGGNSVEKVCEIALLVFV